MERLRNAGKKCGRYAPAFRKHSMRATITVFTPRKRHRAGRDRRRSKKSKIKGGITVSAISRNVLLYAIMRA